MENAILLEHGAGTQKNRALISELFTDKFFTNHHADEDAAYVCGGTLAFTTDSFIIDPDFFEGGNIGKLAICGTANDLAVRGARPLWMSVACILSVGYPIDKLQRITSSMAETAQSAGISIVTGDTKVLDKKDFGGIIINTSGIGEVIHPMSILNPRAGDVLISSGSLGDHAAAILAQREGIYLENPLASDCNYLFPILEEIISGEYCSFIRDMTRGGLTSVLYEMNLATGLGVELEERNIVVSRGVAEFCDLMGMDPLGMANEGKVLLCTDLSSAEDVLRSLRSSPLGRDAAIIGSVTDLHSQVLIHKTDGHTAVLREHTNIPRIC